jgi:hypothetical protein
VRFSIWQFLIPEVVETVKQVQERWSNPPGRCVSRGSEGLSAIPFVTLLFAFKSPKDSRMTHFYSKLCKGTSNRGHSTGVANWILEVLSSFLMQESMLKKAAAAEIQTDLAARVATWKKKIEPVLEEQVGGSTTASSSRFPMPLIVGTPKRPADVKRASRSVPFRKVKARAERRIKQEESQIH